MNDLVADEIDIATVMTGNSQPTLSRSYGLRHNRHSGLGTRRKGQN
jgi:hypothetical protein